MGGCASVDDQDGKRANDAIESQLKKDRKALRNEVKMLLLGAGESGKSTILKQMKLINDTGYSEEEREAFREIVFSNIVQIMRIILEAMGVMGIALEHPDANGVHRSIVLDLPPQLEADVLP
ncbi:G-alpha-domain-containing protein, partial [Caulochytrium protostelioides]